MIELSVVAKQEKNKLSTDSAFLILLDIELQGDTVRICYNTDDIYWNNNLYQAFPFEIGEVSEETNGAEPNVDLKVSNINRTLQYVVEESNGATRLPVILRVVNSNNLDSDFCEIEEHFVIVKTTVDEEFITFTLGAEYSARTRRPLNRYMKNNCPFKFKGLRCGYNGDLNECKHTLNDCRNHNNSKRFGGYAGIDQKGVYASD